MIETCGSYDGKHYHVEEMQAGVNAPPFHSNCRCTTVPYFDDEFTESEKRAARDEDGNSVLVDDMSYKEWKEKYVDNSGESGIIESGSEVMALEYQRYRRNKDTVINHTYINSGEYRNKFDKITDNKEVNRVLYSKAKEMLEHRSGTLYEDMYWIDINTGKVVASALDEQQNSAIKYVDAINKIIAKNENLIAMHTHPQSMPPSAADFNSAFLHEYAISLVICHDGKIFQYTSNANIDVDLYDAYIRKYIKEGFSEYDAQIAALEELKNNYDIDFWEVKI